MKSYTDIEQSKKLTEILSIESADMAWCNNSIKRTNYTDEYSANLYTIKEMQECFDEVLNGWDKYWELIPCWSLAALLEVLPLGIYDEFDNCDYELEINMIDKMPRYIRLGDISHSKFPWDFEKDTLLDNVVESIIWLNDNNYFEL